MRKEYSYIWEICYGAVSSLVCHHPMKERLQSAYKSLIRFKKISVPKEIQDNVDNLLKLLNATEPINNQGRIYDMTMNLTEEEADEIAKKILSLYDTVARKMNH